MSEKTHDILLEKICLPIAEAPRLLRLLTFEGVDSATLFPGFDGVVETLKDRLFVENEKTFYIRQATEN